MSRRQDPDVLALKRCCRALEASSSSRMLVANLTFLWDRYVTHPTMGQIKREMRERMPPSERGAR